MKFDFNIKTTVFFGNNVVKENENIFSSLGNRAYIVTGKTSGSKSGALDEIVNILKYKNIEYKIFNDVVNNPTLPNVKSAGDEARLFKPDYIIGIGGGSPLDACKAIAVLAVNDIDPIKLFECNFENKPLPIIAIPTTAGTGSEITPYSILTRPDLETKKSFRSEDLFPKYALLAPKYTYSLPFPYTVGTALDAFSHAIEGYLSKKSNVMSDLFAEKAIQLFGEIIDSLKSKSVTKKDREKLLYLSMLAGIVISHTGTTILHGMGYCLTYFKNIPHGIANGLLISEYLNHAYSSSIDKVQKILNSLKIKNIEDLDETMKSLTYDIPCISDDEVKKYAKNAFLQRSAQNTSFKLTEKIIINIYNKALGRTV